MARKYQLVYQPSEGMEPVWWEKTLDELLVPNGDEPLLIYMLREADERGLPISLWSKDDGLYRDLMSFRDAEEPKT